MLMFPCWAVCRLYLTFVCRSEYRVPADRGLNARARQDQGECWGTQISPVCFRQSNSDAAAFSLQALCEGGSRLRAATTFYSLLILKKLKAIHLHQRAPYEDISATPGDNFYNEPSRVS